MGRYVVPPSVTSIFTHVQHDVHISGVHTPLTSLDNVDAIPYQGNAVLNLETKLNTGVTVLMLVWGGVFHPRCINVESKAPKGIPYAGLR